MDTGTRDLHDALVKEQQCLKKMTAFNPEYLLDIHRILQRCSNTTVNYYDLMCHFYYFSSNPLLF